MVNKVYYEDKELGFVNIDDSSSSGQSSYSSSKVDGLLSGKNDKVTITDDSNSTLGDDSRFLTAYGSGTYPYTNHTSYVARKLSQIWDYIKSKISSVLGLTATSYGGTAAKSTNGVHYVTGTTGYSAWASGKAYAVGDTIYYTNNYIYSCKTAHTSSSSIIPTNTTYWTRVATPAWGGTIDVSSLFAGLVIAYKIPCYGGSTATQLNLTAADGTTKLGAKTILRNTGNTTTHLPKDSVVLLSYDGTYFRWSDYDSNSAVGQTVTTANAEYPLLSKQNANSNTETTGSRFAAGVTLNPSTKTITATKFKGDLTGTADKAKALDNTAAVGSGTKPVYINASGVPTACSYEINKTVPSNAVFTDTKAASSLTCTSSTYGGESNTTSVQQALTNLAGALGNTGTTAVASTISNGLMSKYDKIKTGFSKIVVCDTSIKNTVRFEFIDIPFKIRNGSVFNIYFTNDMDESTTSGNSYNFYIGGFKPYAVQSRGLFEEVKSGGVVKKGYYKAYVNDGKIYLYPFENLTEWSSFGNECYLEIRGTDSQYRFLDLFTEDFISPFSIFDIYIPKTFSAGINSEKWALRINAGSNVLPIEFYTIWDKPTYCLFNFEFELNEKFNFDKTCTGNWFKVLFDGERYYATLYGDFSKIIRERLIKTVSIGKTGLCPALPDETTTTKYLRQDGTWVTPPDTTYSTATLGFGTATCSTAAATAAKTATITNYALNTGGIIAIKFTYNVPASATLNIAYNSTPTYRGAKAIYFKGEAIKAGVINAGDTATLMYDGSHYILLAIDSMIGSAYSAG